MYGNDKLHSELLCLTNNNTEMITEFITTVTSFMEEALGEQEFYARRNLKLLVLNYDVLWEWTW